MSSRDWVSTAYELVAEPVGQGGSKQTDHPRSGERSRIEELEGTWHLQQTRPEPRAAAINVQSDCITMGLG